MRIFKTWTFKWWEVSLIKLCLISLGIVLGICFSVYLAGLLWLWCVVFIATAIYFIAKAIKEE
ncbi:hypothetical protein KKG36_00950 [Patescibacteria group bacterium]|nr:hypothetical protein [Patescibacteria group bacterium]